MNAEKITASIHVSCTPTEKRAWLDLFAGYRLSKVVRQLLNAKVRRRKSYDRSRI
jgi:hypothetical protein